MNYYEYSAQYTAGMPVLEIEDEYTEKFNLCKQSWIKGAIFGALGSIVLGILFSELYGNFFVATLFHLIPTVMVAATLFGVKYTGDFGLCRFFNGIRSKISGILEFFDGMVVAVWFAWLLIGFLVALWVFGLVFVAMLYPLELLYYWLRSRKSDKQK